MSLANANAPVLRVPTTPVKQTSATTSSASGQVLRPNVQLRLMGKETDMRRVVSVMQGLGTENESTVCCLPVYLSVF
jgi:hypothetical protein